MYTIPLHEWLKQQLPLARHERSHYSISATIAGLVRMGIVNGTLPAGARLPSSRELAVELGIARNTVVEIFDELKGEGYLVAHRGCGTFVGHVAGRLAESRQEPPGGASRALPRSEPLPLSGCGRRYEAHPLRSQQIGKAGRPTHPDAGIFAQALWSRLRRQQARRPHPLEPEGHEPGGLRALRKAIADHVRMARGVRCQPSQVIVTGGKSQSIDLIARLLGGRGEMALVENPGGWLAPEIFASRGLAVASADVDAQGLPVPQRGQCDRPPKLVYLTPSNQYPMGYAMSLERRAEWLGYAAAHHAILIEDDCDGDYRFEEALLPSLQGMDQAGRVLYMGSFDNTLFAGVRVAFVIVPPLEQEVFACAATDFCCMPDAATQQVLAEFMQDGHFATHLRFARVEYAARRAAMEGALRVHLSQELACGAVRISGHGAGLHLTLQLPDGVDDRLLAKDCRQGGLIADPLSACCSGRRFSGLVLSHAALPAAALERVLMQLAPVLRETIGHNRLERSAPAGHRHDRQASLATQP